MIRKILFSESHILNIAVLPNKMKHGKTIKTGFAVNFCVGSVWEDKIMSFHIVTKSHVKKCVQMQF